jgi:hypothetical protein
MKPVTESIERNSIKTAIKEIIYNSPKKENKVSEHNINLTEGTRVSIFLPQNENFNNNIKQFIGVTGIIESKINNLLKVKFDQPVIIGSRSKIEYDLFETKYLKKI